MRISKATDQPGWLSKAIAILTMLFLSLPLIAIVPVSFTSKRYLSMPDGIWSVRHYASLFTNPVWLDSIKTSLMIGVIVAIISTTLAVLFGLGLWYVRSKLTIILSAIVFVPMLMPPVVSAIILYFFGIKVSGLLPFIGFDSVGGVIIAHVLLATPFSLVSFLVALSRVDRKLDMAARALGATLSQSIMYIILPNTKFGIITAALMAFILSWEEITVTLFITSASVVTLPREMWNGMRDNVDPAIAAISSILIVFTIGAILGRDLFVAARTFRSGKRLANTR
ncbi:ABC transporter permease [Shinella sumterensis]|uniref:ABC transporter permease n=1 Tax=Shinella sumterensis TaxID=1967501 RepID=A0AA50CS85_9HYPH|nr:ABC transporter permease [Shinella sumterensis]QOD67174.1 ABC transporter permease [Ochrobactrum sp. MT180101]WLS01066.1 ABC transporter permease [Shinella sumterensis]WLS11862.1 ABC transporter permease [Shinella sumterensis]